MSLFLRTALASYPGYNSEKSQKRRDVMSHTVDGNKETDDHCVVFSKEMLDVTSSNIIIHHSMSILFNFFLKEYSFTAFLDNLYRKMPC